MRSHAAVLEEAAAQSLREEARLQARRQKSETSVDKPATGVVSAIHPPLLPGEAHKLVAVCRRVGHGSIYSEVLLRRPDWQLHPSVKWFADDEHNQYYCPEGSRLVDFCDEMHFSRIAMYLNGRQCMENKAQLSVLVPSLVGDTFYIKDRQWVDGHCPLDKEGDALPWFVKEAEGNEGLFVDCCQQASECMGLARAGVNYVVQQHIRDPMLLGGKKFHLRCHMLNICMEDGETWHVYTYKDAYLNISPNQWAPDDMSRDTQVVIYRSQRAGDWKPWGEVFPKLKACVAETIGRAVAQGKLKGRLGKKQFEISSLDIMVDIHGKVWIIEINMGTVLRDKHCDPDWNDDDMITSAFDIIYPCQGPPHVGQWDFTAKFSGVLVDEIQEPVSDEVADDMAAFFDGLA